MFRLPFIVLQDLLVDCFKPTEVSFFLPSFHLPPYLHVAVWIFLVSESPSVFGSLLSPRRTSSQSCSTRSEGCRSSPHLRRNDGVPPPLRLSPHPSSSYRNFFPFTLMSVVFHRRPCYPVFHLFLSLPPGFSPMNRFYFLKLFVTLPCCLSDFLLKNNQQRRSKVVK